MKLKKDGLITQFYKWSYSYGDDQLTQNFCGYFWALVLACLLTPFTIWSAVPGLAWKDFGKSRPPLGARFAVGFGTYLVGTLLTMLGFALYANPYNTLVGIGISVGIVGFVALLIYVLIGRDDAAKVGRVFDEAMEIAAEKVESVKEDYCPKIDWK